MQGIKINKLLPCPFCNRDLKFYKDTHITKYGTEVTEQYYMHDYDVYTEPSCLLDELMEVMTIGAGDADIEAGNIGEYAEKWNTAIKTYNARIIQNIFNQVLNTPRKAFFGRSLKEKYEIESSGAYDDGWNSCYEDFMLMFDWLREENGKDH